MLRSLTSRLGETNLKGASSTTKWQRNQKRSDVNIFRMRFCFVRPILNNDGCLFLFGRGPSLRDFSLPGPISMCIWSGELEKIGSLGNGFFGNAFPGPTKFPGRSNCAFVVSGKEAFPGQFHFAFRVGALEKATAIKL